MSKSKMGYRDIIISRAGGGDGEESSFSKKSQTAGEQTKTIHPPIESHWLLHPVQETKPSSSSSTSGIKSMLFYPQKIRDSIKKLGRSKSLQLVLEGTRDPKDEQLVESFRELLFLQVDQGQLLGKHNDYHTLLRFLRMRDFDLSKAKDAFINYLHWREDYRVDAIQKEFKFEEYAEVKKCYPHGYHGVDRTGRPVYIERIGMVDLNSLLQATTIDRFAKYHVSQQEQTLNLRFPACSLAAKRHVASTTSIFDVKGVGMANFSKPARYLFMEIQKIDSNYYPETLHQLFIINAGSGFKMLWKALRAFLDARTLAKIHVLGSNYLSNLLEIIDPSNLPSFLGGNCTCADYGGCLFSDKGPWNNPEIVEIIQAISVREQLENNGENSDLLTEDALGEGQSKDGPAGQEDSELGETKVVEKIEAEKLHAFEAALVNANNKIQALETALKDTKMVLKGLGQLMRELRTQI